MNKQIVHKGQYNIPLMLQQMKDVMGSSSELTFTLQDQTIYIRITAFRGRRLSKVITVDLRKYVTCSDIETITKWNSTLKDIKLGLELLEDASIL